MIRHFLSIVAIIAVLLATNTFAEDEAKDQVYVINTFEKGLNTKTNEMAMPEWYGVSCENVRFNKELGSLSKRSNLNVYGTADATNGILGMHRLYNKNGDKVLLVNVGNTIKKGSDSTGAFTTILTVPSGDHRWQWVTWHDIAIGTDGYNQPVKYDGSSASATYLGSCLATDAGSGSGPDGTYTYKVSFYTATYEVILDVPSNTITVSDNDIELTMLPLAPDTFLGEDVVGRKVYRTASGGSTYKLLTNGTIADNTTVTLTDSDADGALGANYPTVDNSTIFEDQVPIGKFILVHGDALWLANDPSNSPSRAWHSETSCHDYFPSDYYWDIRSNDGDEITFIKQVLNILTIGKNNSIQKLYTSGTVDEWSLSNPFTFIGCQAPYTAQNTPIGLMYLGRDGLYIFNGQYSQLVSDVITPTISSINSTDLINCWGIYHNSMYYMAYSSVEPSEGYNNRVIVFDFQSQSYAIDTLNINCFCSFNSGDDWGILYGGGSDVGKVYSYSEEDNQIVHKVQSDFSGLWDDCRYIPVGVGGIASSPILEISRTETIDELSGTIDELVGIIDRQDSEGHYVSQVLSVNAGTFDKLYWNEYMPISGGDISIQLRTSATGEENLLLNDCFELWDNCIYAQATTPTTIVQPNDWVAASTSTSVVACASEGTVTYRGNYSARVNTEATISQILFNGDSYAGKNLTYNAWIKSSNTVADKVYIELDDEYSTSRAYYTNSGDWEETSTTLAVNALATKVTVKCATLSDSDAPAYFDQVMCKEGTSCSNDWTAWSSEYTDPSGSDISSETVNSYLQYLVNISCDNIMYSPNLVRQNNYVIKINYDKEGTAQSSSIPMYWESAWLDLGSPSREKILRRIYVIHEGVEGAFNITVENFEGETDSFDVDLSLYPKKYTERFTGGSFRGQYFKVKISSDDANDLNIKKVIFVYDTLPKIYN